METEVIETRGKYRVKIARDELCTEPEFDAGSPIVEVWSTRSYFGGNGIAAEAKDYGIDSAAHSGLPDNAADIIEKLGSIETFERYLRIFHGGKVITYGPNNYTDSIFVSYTTAKMIDYWGCKPEYGEPNLDEWISFIEGDVWLVTVEEIVKWQRLGSDGEPVFLIDGEITKTTYEEVETVGGHYGRKWAEEAAHEALGGYEEEAA